MQEITGCNPKNGCKRCKDCDLYYINRAKTLQTSFPIEDYSDMNSTLSTYIVDPKTGITVYDKDKIIYNCGEKGKYKMFTPYVPKLEGLTLGEIKEICYDRHKQNNDCESCKIYNFCNYQMTTRDPSDWELNK